MKVLSAIALASATFVLATPSIQSQSISIGMRGTGSIPTGSFSDTQTSSDATVIAGAKNGFGYGLDVGLGLGMFGVYGGFDHIKFDCETTTCTSNGKFTLQGVAVGVKLSPVSVAMFRPFVKAGVTFNDLQRAYGASSSSTLTTDKTPGYELGAGADLSFMGLFSLVPQVRYVGQKLKAKIPGVSAPAAEGQSVNYLAFDLGLSVHSPFGSMRRAR
jgi:Outer membrane protein beta-barrel domain